MLELTTVARVKTLHGAIRTDSLDGQIQALIRQASRRIERWLDADFKKTTYTQVFTVVEGQCIFALRAFPIDTAAAFTVKNEWGGDFTVASTIDSRNYYIDALRGRLIFRGINYALISGPGTLQVAYTGGIAADVDTLVASDDYLDLVFACEQQVLAEMHRTPNFGSSSRNVGGASQSFDDDKDDSGLLPSVKRMIEHFRRA